MRWRKSLSGIGTPLTLLGLFVSLSLAPHFASSQTRETTGTAIGSAKSVAGGVRRSRGRPHHYSTFMERSPCAILERRYVSSPLEQKWLQAASTWKAAGNGNVADITPYCTLLTESKADIQRMLDLVSALMKSNTTLSDAPDADAVLSYFNITMQCGPYTFTQKEHIEPLVAALRHPFSIQCPSSFSQLPNPPADIFSKEYVLLAGWRGQVQAARDKYYIDAGAGVGYLANSNQYWMMETYEARGISMDRALFWEAQEANGPDLFQDVPPRFFPAFAFYNIPAPADLNDGRNPLNVVTRLARPQDFVSVKLDIDQSEIEDVWLRAILGGGPTGRPKSRYAELIDELFWEHHFDFEPMKTCCWGTLVDQKSQLVDSMRMFMQLRELGIRTHYWQ